MYLRYVLRAQLPELLVQRNILTCDVLGDAVGVNERMHGQAFDDIARIAVHNTAHRKSLIVRANR